MSRTVFIIVLTFLGASYTSRSSTSFINPSNAGLVQPASCIFDGTVIRLEVAASGLYQIDGAWLTQNTNLPAGIAFDQVSLYAIFGGHLKHDSQHEETERLRAIPFQIMDNGDNSWDADDRIRFYAEGPDRMSYDLDSKLFSSERNPFSNTNFVFLKINGQVDQPQLDIEATSEVNNPTDEYWYFTDHDDDLVNLLDDFISAQGSGQKWYGTELTNRRSFKWSDEITLPADGIRSATIKAEFVGRSRIREEVVLSIGQNEYSNEFSPVNTTDIEALYARHFEINITDQNLASADEIIASYDREHPDGRVWLDKISIQGWTKAIYEKRQIRINNRRVTDTPGFDGIQIAATTEVDIWDVTDPYHPLVKNVSLSSGFASIASSSETLQEIIISSPGDMFVPIGASAINPLDIFNIPEVDMVIIAPEILFDQAEQLKAHRESFSGIRSYILSPQQIYDSYSSGKVDPTAIRNYVRDLYYSLPSFKYLLLFGDASFDYRHINKSHDEDNLVPTFETFNSLDPLLAFPTDDYYALLDNDENGQLVGDLDIAVGRITVSDAFEAADVVRKFINYDLTEDGNSAWKSRIVFLADDEDNNLHINDADVIAEEFGQNAPLFNQKKIYFDAYKQESTPGGNRYPTATEDLNQSIEDGVLVMNYLGHGGPNGWGQERVLKIDDINSWSNFKRLPLIVTATCSFTGFDDPSLNSAGERALLKPNGGALSLFTTVRSVFASKNFQLTRSVFRELFQKESGSFRRLGEIMRRAKNENPNDNTNARKFFLIGDPSIKLNFPDLDVQTDQINGSSNTDSLRLSALDQVMITGSIRDQQSNLVDDFNGEVEVIVFDKENNVQTLGNDQRSFIKRFKSQQNIIYQGKASVINGRFNINFVVPIDINYTVGKAKISYFALSDNGVEAAGFSKQLLIGGESVAPIDDDTPPDLQAFINTRSFQNGDVVPPSNQVIIDVQDDFGVNLSNTAIGHEITATLDDDSKTTLFLNEFFEPSNDLENGGTIQFNLIDLSEGKHSLKIRAFDIANNLGETEIFFEVSPSVERLISDIRSIPNPISERTSFTIQHDMINGSVLVSLLVYDTKGALVDRRSFDTIAEDGISIIEWEPNFNNSGTFVCHFTLISPTSGESTRSHAEKVVVLK